MKRSWTLWLVFAGCAAVVIAALAWVSVIVLRLEEAGEQSQQHARLEESARLALWRMESMLAPFIAQENARPYYVYQAFFPADRAYTRMLARLEPSEILIPSPLLTNSSSHVRLYFQLGPAGELSSPQIPLSLHVRTMEGSNARKVEESARQLKQFARDIPRQALLDVAPAEWLSVERRNDKGAGASSHQEDRRLSAKIEESNLAPLAEKIVAKQKELPLASGAKAPAETQSQASLAHEVIKNSPVQFANDVVLVPQQLEQKKRSEVEYMARLNANNLQNVESANTQRMQQANERSKISDSTTDMALQQGPAPVAANVGMDQLSEKDQIQTLSQDKGKRQARLDSQLSRPAPSQAFRPPPRPAAIQPPEIQISLLKPVWVHDELILVRRIRINQDEYLQGCWLDWPHLQSWLIAGIRDLLPQAWLEAKKDANDLSRSLAALPILLQPGRLAANVSASVSPLKFSLWVAWLCVIAAVLATGILLWGTHALSERRAAFVSAVTHELRTPLTTFRLYTEMLAEGMVPDAEQQRQYLNTLKQEADRQYHLIENVLAYSRMEKGRYGRQKEALCLGAWLERIQPRLAELAERFAMTLIPANGQLLDDLHVLTDAGALERILINLVDNACKYARSAADKRIHIEVSMEGKKVRLRVRDHGPGIASKDMAKLFQPFHKSARDAANSAPGVGLGLSLCRRLAQSIGGELLLEQNSDAGASFSLLLPHLQEK